MSDGTKVAIDIEPDGENWIVVIDHVEKVVPSFKTHAEALAYAKTFANDMRESEGSIGVIKTYCAVPAKQRPAPMYREITTHQVNGCNSALKLEVMDGPGPGGACHVYRIQHLTPCGPFNHHLNFQNGAIKEVGTNGITHEVLLAILIDRLECFQRGPYKCEENERALESLIDAKYALTHRTKRRVDAGIEGTMQPDPIYLCDTTQPGILEQFPHENLGDGTAALAVAETPSPVDAQPPALTEPPASVPTGE